MVDRNARRTPEQAQAREQLTNLAEPLGKLGVQEIVDELERKGPQELALAYRTLPTSKASAVFERLDPPVQRQLLAGLEDGQVKAVFTDLAPDDRVGLMDELPAEVATQLLAHLPPDERDLTHAVFGYPRGSIGRRMSPEYVTTEPHLTAAQTFERVREQLHEAETIYYLPVVATDRTLLGIISLRDVIAAEPDTLVSEFMVPAVSAPATEDAETVARESADMGLAVQPIVDTEGRLVGILTIDDALEIVEYADTEDHARGGGAEPLRQPYLTTPVMHLVRSRLVWLLVLAIGATLTVQVLEVFEATLAQMVVLSVFIPLLIGIGGNTGNQAATTLTRAVALDDVQPRDVIKVLWREIRVGALLGATLGTLGFVAASLFYSPVIGAVIGLTILAVCTMAASVGGVMPLVAKKLGVDPAVFSNPFISTFVDATGLVVYFLIAKAILGL